ncbi:MAG TPA: glycosyltransferase family 10 [Bacteroidales bacterium]|nr:glycosyltransferase family 10 [Bacteroidales bacterium]
METIKIDFVDFYPNFVKNNNELYNALAEKFNLQISSSPDYIIYSCYGNEHLKYDGIKIFFTGENLVPDFNFCDYAIGFHFIDFEDRYLRLPLSVIRGSYKNIADKKIDREKALNRKFCNFVYSNQGNAHPIRNKFFNELSKYKKVDSGGKAFNNIGGAVADKFAFIAEYKFTIAIENSSVNGYVTEKIVEPMSVNSVPVYWGSKSIGADFNTDAFVVIRDDSDEAIREAIQRIRFLDQNDDEYLKLLSQPWVKPGQYVNFEETLQQFFGHIVSQPFHTAGRRALNGFNMRYVGKMIKFYESVKNRTIDNEISFREIMKLLLRKVKRKMPL